LSQSCFFFFLKKEKVKLYKKIKKNSSSCNTDEFMSLIDKYRNFVFKFLKNVMNIKKMYHSWNTSGCEYIKIHNLKKSLEMVKEGF